jgi:hypothetical protein
LAAFLSHLHLRDEGIRKSSRLDDESELPGPVVDPARLRILGISDALAAEEEAEYERRVRAAQEERRVRSAHMGFSLDPDFL